ncbi:hypothetical protein FRC07_006360 [Ceratobasidium sp. 392]|nr:hypothetical protein FRC07_006360 [Ceratobasidium sp. 392]
MPFPVFDRPPARRPNAPDPYVFVDHLGEPLPIFLHKDLAARDALAQLVTAGGGELVQTMRQSVFLIVDPMSSDGQDTIDGYGDRPDKRVLRPEWLQFCVVAGRIAIANDWAGCRLGRGPPARKRPAEETQFDNSPSKHPRTEPAPLPIPQPPPPAPPPTAISYAYNPAAYPLVPGYYAPPPPPQVAQQQVAQQPTAIPYSYYESTPAAGAGQGQIKKRAPRPPRQPNRPWSLDENIALYNFMAQHPAPTEREQATLVRRWAKETRPDRGRQSWVAHAFATSFKNWVKEYEAGNINANPADFGPSADADGEADPDTEHDTTEHETFTGGPFVESESQSQQSSGNGAAGAGPGPSFTNNGSFNTTPPGNGPTPPTTTAGQGQGQAFSQFNVPQEAGNASTNAPEEGQKQEGNSAENSNANTNTNGNVDASNAAGFPPMYPMVYPPVENEQPKEGA